MREPSRGKPPAPVVGLNERSPTQLYFLTVTDRVMRVNSAQLMSGFRTTIGVIGRGPKPIPTQLSLPMLMWPADWRAPTRGL